ncbi:MAG: hypothetical protein WAN81_12220 [Candidatus Binataceae bacterium]
MALLLSSASSASGLILVLFMIGLRRLGAAQTGAYFSLAPFIGALIAIVFLGEPLTAKLALMGFGLWFHLAERHQHEHLREELEHEHKHTHDDHQTMTGR